MPLLRSGQVRRIEDAAARLHGAGPAELMQRAGLAAWRLLLERWPRAFRIGIVCGPGNNGGDGYVLARLALASGRPVRVLVLPNGAPRSALCHDVAAQYVASGGDVQIHEAGSDLPDVDIWVDALFGIGLTRDLDAATHALIQAINADGVPVLALDVPSGVDADSGRAASAVSADVTLTFIAAKLGLLTGEGRVRAGSVLVADLGLPPSLIASDSAATALRPGALAQWLPRRALGAHKGHHGHVLCVGGDTGFGGAIVLCAESALRCGAGLVSVATRAGHIAPLLARRPECMATTVDSAAQLLPLIERASVIAIGPGLGQGEWGEGLLDAVLASGKPLVFDADALNALARRPRKLADAVLSPHPGEAARLLGVTVAAIEADRLAAAAQLAERYACVIVLKGAGTVVAAPGATARVIDAGNPGMAVGGMGDVLTGAIAALRAQGLTAFEAASCAALLHAAAGDMAAADGGERGLLPGDLMPCLRRLANPDPTDVC